MSSDAQLERVKPSCARVTGDSVVRKIAGKDFVTAIENAE